MFSFNTLWDLEKNLKLSYDFREYWKKTLERNGLMLPWEVFHEVCTKPNASFWTLVSPCTHIYSLGLPSSLTCDAYVMFFANHLSRKKLPNIKPIEILSENNRRDIVFCLSHNIYKENARNFLQVICTWSEIFRNFSMFFALDFWLLSDALRKRLKFHINVHRLEALKTMLLPLAKNDSDHFVFIII